MPNRLFIGGSADGQLLGADESQDTYFYQTEVGETEVYHREKVQGRKRSFIFFASESLTSDDVIDYLIRGYRGYEPNQDAA